MRLTIAYSKIKKAKSSVGYNKDASIPKRNFNKVTRSTALDAKFSKVIPPSKQVLGTYQEVVI